MDIRPELNVPSPASILCRGDTGLCFRHARCHDEKYPDDRLGSDPLDSVNWSFELVLKGMHPDIGGVIHNRDDRGREQLTCRCR